MSKQIPLRLDDDDLEKLELIKAHTYEKTANKAMVKLLHKYMPIYDRMRAAEQQVIELNIKINQIRQHYQNMMYYKGELESLIK